MLSFVMLTLFVMVAPDAQQTQSAAQCRERLSGKWIANLTDQKAVILQHEQETVRLFSLVNDKMTLLWRGEFVISESEPNRHLDWKDRHTNGGQLPDNQCLYRLTGDTLLLIGGGPDRRPENFLSGAGSEPKTIVFTRLAPSLEN